MAVSWDLVKFEWDCRTKVHGKRWDSRGVIGGSDHSDLCQRDLQYNKGSSGDKLPARIGTDRGVSPIEKEGARGSQ